MSKILITGGAGFIGFSLAKKLSENSSNSLVLVDNLSRGALDDELSVLIKENKINFIQGDLTDKHFIAELDNDFNYIYHLAAVIGVQNVTSNPEKVLNVNAVSTINLLEYAKTASQLKRFIFSSTSEVYAGTLTQGLLPVPTPEDVLLCLADIGNERSTYALSKIYGESIVTNYGKKFGVPYTILRYHNVYGPRMGYQHVIPELILKIKERDTLDLHSPTHTRAFCYIDDAIDATILCSEKLETTDQVVNIGNSSEEIAIRSLAEKISQTLAKPIEIKAMPDTAGSPSRRCPDISKLKKLVGFVPSVQLSNGIKRTADWYLKKEESKNA